jgi:hypothetical protein
MLSQQQAMNQITMATLAKCVSIITRNDAKDPNGSKEASDTVKSLREMFEACKKVVADTDSTPASDETNVS